MKRKDKKRNRADGLKPDVPSEGLRSDQIQLHAYTLDLYPPHTSNNNFHPSL